MELKEIERRIKFLGETKQKAKRAEIKTLTSLIHMAVAFGSNATRDNNRLFERKIEEIFGEK